MTRSLKRLTFAAPLIAAVVAVAIAAGATAARPIPGKAITARGLGSLRLGMTERSAHRLLRKFGMRTRVKLREVNVRPGVRYLEYEYRTGGFSTAYIVGFQGQQGRERVVMASTYLRQHRTKQGIRVAVVATRLYRAYGPRLRCRQLFQGGGAGHFIGNACALGPASGRQIIFIVPANPVVSGQLPPPPDRVSRIMVRERGLVVSIA
jgi:hypothetical protein